MARFRQGDPLDQPFLLPPSMADWLSEGHLAWFIDDAVEQLDIESISASYRICGKGELPYHPRMMLKVLFYAYSTGIFSSRRIAAQLEDSVAFRVLARGQMPSHRTICRFREQFIDVFEDLFVQVVRFAASSGMVSLGQLAIDGSKVKANASKHKAMSYDRMKTEEKRLRAEIRAITRMAANLDADEDVEFGEDFRGDELPEELSTRKKRLAAIQKAKRELEERKAAEEAERRAEQEKKARDEGRDPPKQRKTKHPRGKPKPKDQQNFTDPDSRIMKSKGGFEQCYNAQAAVDSDHQIIVAAAVTNCAADNGQLMPMIRSAEANAGLDAHRVLADAGYKSESNLQALEDSEIDGYVALGREGGDPLPYDDQPATARMDRKLRTKRGRSRFKRRKHIVEPVFGWAKNVLRFTSFSLRGCRKVAGEWSLVCLALNLRRMRGYEMTWEIA
jgi:transposase